MATKIKIVFFFSLLMLYSCTVASVSSTTKKMPTKSFVKVFHTLDIVSCTDPKDNACPTGRYLSSGSGMAINLFRNEMTVLTAGHVCEKEIKNTIKKSAQIVQVLDHRGKIHQSWPISINHNDQKGISDLCLLWVPTLKVEKINFSIIKPDVGEELIYIGAPMGIYHPPTVPIFKGIYSGLIDPSSAMITAPAIGGSSGAAVLNSRKQIVGVIWGANPHFHNVSIMTSHRSFIKFLRDAVSKIAVKDD